MEQTLFLAQFLGLFSIILAVVIILRRKMVVHVIEDFLKNRTQAFFVGLAESAGGLFLILKHSTFNGTLETVITVLGWLFFLEGIFYIFTTKKIMRNMISMFDNISAYYFFAVLYLLLGVYLVYAGFGLSI